MPPAMPQVLPRGLVFLAIAGAVQTLGGVILVAVLTIGGDTLDLDPGDSSTFILIALANLSAGVAEIVLVVLAWRRQRTAAYILMALALVLGVVACWDVLAVLTSEKGNIAFPALRLGANLAGAIALISCRSWFGGHTVAQVVERQPAGEMGSNAPLLNVAYIFVSDGVAKSVPTKMCEKRMRVRVRSSDQMMNRSFLRCPPSVHRRRPPGVPSLRSHGPSPNEPFAQSPESAWS